mgnify:CR=1 FL=1
MNDIIFAVLYTLVVFSVSMFYFFHGKREGYHEVLSVLHEQDPQAFQKLRDRLKEMIV